MTIFGRTYHLRGGGEPEYLERLAASVDTKMREVASATGTADTLRLAILAALNLADDAERRAVQADDGGVTRDARSERRIERMIRDIDAALAE